MKRGNRTQANSEFRQRRPAQLAERELQHLEMILSNLGERSAEQSRLSAKYWDMRIAQLDTDYDLVPSQAQRIASLQRKIALLDAAIDRAALQAYDIEPDDEDTREARRAAA